MLQKGVLLGCSNGRRKRSVLGQILAKIKNFNKDFIFVEQVCFKNFANKILYKHFTFKNGVKYCI